MRFVMFENQTSKDKDISLVRRRLYTVAILIIIAFISFLPLLVGRIVFTDQGISQNDLMLFLVLPFLAFSIMLIGPFIAMRISPQSASFKIKWFRKKRSEVVWLFLLPLVLIIVTGVFRSLIEQLQLPISATILWTGNTVLIITYLFQAALLGPIAEEIFWRGFVQDRLEKTFGPWIALLAQAVGFALFHIRPIGGILDVFVFGLIFGFWRYKRKTLLPVIFAHVIFNSIWCAVWWHNRAEMAKINPSVDYVSQFNEISRPSDYDPNHNAAKYYEKAFELMAEQPQQLSKKDIKSWPMDLSEEKRVLCKKWVSANSEALEQLKLGSKKPYYWIEHHADSMWDVILPELAESRALTYAICLRAKLNAIKGDYNEAFSDSLICYQFGKHLQSVKRTMVEQLVGIAIKDSAVETCFEILDKTEAGLRPELLNSLQYDLRSVSSKKRFMDFTAWKFILCESIQMSFTDDGKGDGYIPRVSINQMADPPEYQRVVGIEGIPIEAQGNLAELSRRETFELVEVAYDYLNSVTHITPAEINNKGIDIEKTFAEKTNDNSFLSILMPAANKIINLSHRVIVETDALITTLALLRYKADKGQLPESLQELLSSGYVEQLPMDPFSNAPLVYNRIDDNFTLYSYGEDFDDDGGLPSEWGKGEKGGDQVFWLVDE
jgi:membrane protease YdiL (CAAX protease family)